MNIKPNTDENGKSKRIEENAARLRKNITVMNDTFSMFGLKVLNVGGLDYEDFVGGPGIKFYVEIMSESDKTERPDMLTLKMNVYDRNDDLLAMGSRLIDMKKFTGYDTYDIVVLHQSIHERAAGAKVYLTR